MTCVACGRDVLYAKDTVLCSRCDGPLHQRCSQSGRCPKSVQDECRAREDNKWDMQAAIEEDTAASYHRARVKANPKRCPNCGGPLNPGEGFVSCGRCPYTAPEVVPDRSINR